MAPWFIIPLRMLGLAAAGFALGAGWKLGSHLIDVATGKSDLLWPPCSQKTHGEAGSDSLLRRKYSKISED